MGCDRKRKQFTWLPEPHLVLLVLDLGVCFQTQSLLLSLPQLSYMCTSASPEAVHLTGLFLAPWHLWAASSSLWLWSVLMREDVTVPKGWLYSNSPRLGFSFTYGPGYTTDVEFKHPSLISCGIQQSCDSHNVYCSSFLWSPGSSWPQLYLGTISSTS